ncbi:MAG: acyl-CoA dehydrogenase family protein [Bacteroidales bacterium]|nr:acyl-CoA dehydrogenase family protein [Bacteroidales bacterium]
MANFYKDNQDLKFQLSNPLMERIVELKENNYADYGKYDYAPKDLKDAIDSYDKVMDIVGQICGDIIAPNAEQVDIDGPVCKDGRVTYAEGTKKNQEALTKAGVYGIALPRKYDGLNFSMVPYVMAAELVGRADAGYANIWGLQDCAETIAEFASEEIKAEFLPRINKGETCSMDLTEPDAGSDLQAVMLKATWDEEKQMWMLNGVKRFITNGDADIKLVLARSEEGTSDARGLSYFVHDKKWGGVTVRRIENKLGIHGSPTCELVFRNAPAKIVGDRKMGLIKYVMSLMNGARLGVGAQSVGISEAAYREALKYANEREQFGKKIIEFPAVYEMLAVMKAKLQASRAILYETSRCVDVYKALNALVTPERKLTPEERKENKKYSRYADMLTPLLKMTSSEFCNQNAYDAIQVHGGSGFMKEYPVERLYRDARITTIYEGTSQLQTVAAIRYVTNGSYLEMIRNEYETVEIKVSDAVAAACPDAQARLEKVKARLLKMTEQYEKTVALMEGKPVDYIDFQARKMCEMAAFIIESYLLLIDSLRCERFIDSAEVFSERAQAWNNERHSYIYNCDSESILPLCQNVKGDLDSVYQD